MSDQLEEPLLDFNLDFLQETSNKVLIAPEKYNDKNEKCRIAINVAKKKIVATDSLIRKYYEKKEELEQLEKALYSSKEECKQVCIDFRNVTDRCNNLDNEVQVLQKSNLQLQAKCSEQENFVDAMKSHVHQLQTLVKENETVIEGLKIENQLRKANVDDYEKRISNFQKDSDILLNDISLMKDIIFGKRKLKRRYRRILEKYNKSYESDGNDSVLGGTESDDDTNSHCIYDDIYEEKILPSKTHVKNYASEIEPVMAKNDNDLESDFSNEQASADTGRGSSLAFSDNDKCFHSPDYFMDHSPIDTEDITEKIKINHIATSPNCSDQKVDTATILTDAKQSIFSPPCSKVVFEANEVIDFTESGYDNQTKILPTEKQFDDSKYVHKNAITKVSAETPVCHNEFSEKECLEMNNSNKFNENNRSDGEIELILSKMRLPHSLITPIPTTPLKPGYSLPDSMNNESNLSMPDHNFVCKDAIKVKEENIAMKASLLKLANEIETIKAILKNKNLLTLQNLTACNTDIESDINNDNPMIIPAEVNQNNYESLNLKFMNHSISGEESSFIDECDIIKTTKKSLKRLEFEEPVLSLQNGSHGLLPKPIQEKDDQKEDMSDVRNIDGNTSPSIRKAYKQRKLTKLDRLRQKLVPKNKIKANIAPLRTSRKKYKQRIINGVTDKVALSLKNKKAYEKAVKIMAELKSQQKTGIAHKIISIANKDKQTSKKINGIPINRSQCKISSKPIISIPKISSPNKNVSIQMIDQKPHDQQISKKIIILEDILLTNSQNCNEKKETQESINTCLADVSVSKNTNKTILIEKEHCSGNVPQSKISQKEENINVRNISADRLDMNNKETETKNDVIENEQQMQQQFLPNDSNTERLCLSPCAEKVQNAEFKNKVSNELREVSYDTKNRTPKTEKLDINISLDNNDISPKNSITTRSRTRIADNSSPCQIKHSNSVDDQLKSVDEIGQALNNNEDKNDLQQRTRKRQNRMSDDKSDIACKRRLRSSTLRLSSSEENIKDSENTKSTVVSALDTSNIKLDNTCINLSQEESEPEAYKQIQKNIVSYGDLDLFNTNTKPNHSTQNSATEKQVEHPKYSILCTMLDKYGKRSIKNFSKKISDSVINTVRQTIENEISKIIEAPNKDSKQLMIRFVNNIKKWDCKQFMAGLMQYLKDPQRKIELFSKTCTAPAPPMTKSEQILLYVVIQLNHICWTNINVVDCLLSNMEYVLFKLNRTPGFDTIESMSHFYAIICRYFKMKSRLRLFMLDAMYCIQFKSVPLIKQCMEVWMHVLPLAHMGIAKSTLVTCMVYLLHFYKCEDKFNRVQEIRYLLSRKYFYEITEWNEPKIIEMFRNAIRDVRAIPVEMKLLRIALIVIAKRHGPRWCQKNIIKNLLLPMIESNDSERVKIFCVSMLGPLLRVYPIEMRVHLEIIMNMLLDMLNQNPSPKMQEAIFTSLIYMSRHNYNRVVQTLLTWNPQRISPEFEILIRDFVCQKPLKMWKTTLSKMNVM